MYLNFIERIQLAINNDLIFVLKYKVKNKLYISNQRRIDQTPSNHHIVRKVTENMKAELKRILSIFAELAGSITNTERLQCVSASDPVYRK